MNLLLLLLTLQTAPEPDVVTLKNGDRITGTIVVMTEGLLVMTTEYAKELKIDITKVRNLATSRDHTVELIDGEKLKGRLVAGPEGTITVESTIAGKTASVEFAKVKALNPPEKPAARYRGSLTLAGMASSGNTDRMAMTVAADAERRTDEDRLSFRFLWNYAEENDVRSSRNVFVGMKYDYFFTKWGYGYLAGELLSDEFKDLDLRAVGSIGLGWQALDRPDMTLLLEGGLAYISNNFDEGDDNSEVAMRLASQYMWKITDGVTFTDLMVTYPFRKENEFLWRNEASIAVSLGEFLGGGWSLKFSNLLDYDSEPSGDRKRLDVLWLAGIQFTFK